MQLAQCVAHSKCSRNIVIFIDFEKLFTKILEYDKIEEIFTFSNNFPQDIIKLMKINLKCFKPNPIIFPISFPIIPNLAPLPHTMSTPFLLP